MNDYNKNLSRLEWLKTFKGGDNDDIPLCDSALAHMRYIVEKCEEYKLPQPKIRPWPSGNGVQAQWEYDWYLEINSSTYWLSIAFIKEENYDDAVAISVTSIEAAFKLVKMFINQIVDLDKGK